MEVQITYLQYTHSQIIVPVTQSGMLSVDVCEWVWQLMVQGYHGVLSIAIGLAC